MMLDALVSVIPARWTAALATSFLDKEIPLSTDATRVAQRLAKLCRGLFGQCLPCSAANRMGGANGATHELVPVRRLVGPAHACVEAPHYCLRGQLFRPLVDFVAVSGTSCCTAASARSAAAVASVCPTMVSMTP